MSHRDEDSVNYIDMMSSGDSNTKNSKQTPKTKEVNNNEVEALSQELSKMGCVVDAMKRPPNICVEDCVYESDAEKSQTQDPEDAYSDEFEDDDDDDKLEVPPAPSNLKLSKSQGSVPSTKMSARSGTTDFGLVETLVGRDVSVEWQCGVPDCLYHRGPVSESTGQRTDRFTPSITTKSNRRINMSFSNERMREIDRHNNILLTKIIGARNTKRQSSIPSRDQPPPRRPLPSASLQRKNHQRQIDHDNLILLKKIQRAKSSQYSGIRR